MVRKSYDHITGLRGGSGAGEITTDDSMVGRAVKKTSAVQDSQGKNTWELVDDNDEVEGTILSVKGLYVNVARKGSLRYRKGQNASIPVGAKILGALRTVGSTNNVRGFVKAADTTISPTFSQSELQYAIRAKGSTTNGGAVNADTSVIPPVDVEVYV